jgi:hypothetical protein
VLILSALFVIALIFAPRSGLLAKWRVRLAAS